MAISPQTDLRAARKPLAAVARSGAPCPSGATLPERSSARPRSPSRHLTVDQYVRLLALIEDEGGVTTLDEIAHALPRVPQSVSAVFDLCDAGVLQVDWETAFDGDTRVWRIDR